MTKPTRLQLFDLQDSKPVLFGAVVGCLLAASVCATSETFTVGPSDEDFAKVQDAIDAATHGDKIIVSASSYVENINFRGKNITLSSVDPQDPGVVETTIIDAGHDGTGVTFAGSESSACILSGFTIRHGNARYGGGIQGNHAKATIRNNFIKDNSATGGGGIAHCNGTILQNTVSNNSAGWGGGFYGCDGIIRDCTITSNFATTDGGGIYKCQGMIRNNVIVANISDWRGGAFFGSHATIQNNRISANRARSGGGGFMWCHGTIQNNSIVNNRSFQDGAGIFVCQGTIQNNIISGNSSGNGAGLHGCNGLIQNNIISGNSAVGRGGGLLNCHGPIQNNIITGNATMGGTHSAGGGLYNCDGVIINNIIWNNIALEGSQVYPNSATPSYCCIQDWSGGGLGNIAADPQFVEAGYWTDGAGQSDWIDGDYHLQIGSPCVDGGAHESEYNDSCLPPGMNTVRNDMGAYGGPENCTGVGQLPIQTPTVTQTPTIASIATPSPTITPTRTPAYTSTGTQTPLPPDWPRAWILDGYGGILLLTAPVPTPGT